MKSWDTSQEKEEQCLWPHGRSGPHGHTEDGRGDQWRWEVARKGLCHGGERKRGIELSWGKGDSEPAYDKKEESEWSHFSNLWHVHKDRQEAWYPYSLCGSGLSKIKSKIMAALLQIFIPLVSHNWAYSPGELLGRMRCWGPILNF